MARPTLVFASPPQVISAGDRGWPVSLDALSDPPSRLRIAGALPALQGAVAIVGTRFADDAALLFARKLGAALASAGRVVISGGALGIDAAAHRGALDAGGLTVSVLATGLTRPYPKEHLPLFSEIAERGALVTEQADDMPPVGWAFLARNRLIAALAQQLVVIQAPLRSGALSTAAIANKLKKPVFAVPYAPWDVRGEGCVMLLRRGARICTSPRDVLSVPPFEAAEAALERPSVGENTINVSELDEDGRAVLRKLGSRPLHPDELAAALGLPIMKVQQALLQLLLIGLAEERDSGRYVNCQP